MQQLCRVMLLLLVTLETPPTAAAVPTFTDPLTFTNPYQPFQPGAVKVFRGRKDGAPSILVDLYLTAARTFRVGGADVPAHILQETEFENGAVVEISQNFLAQADDGTVFYFGELVDGYENGVVTSHEGSWLVGGATMPSDPAETANAAMPAVFMPATPQVGSSFRPEDLFPIVDETDEVKAIGLSVGTPAGRFGRSIRVVETTQLGDPPETKWYGAGVGVLKGKTKGETFALVASTLRP
jgi:hypothetical protein